MSQQWRVGRSWGRTLVKDEKLVGMVDTAELATEIVKALKFSQRARCMECELTVVYCECGGTNGDEGGSGL